MKHMAMAVQAAFTVALTLGAAYNAAQAQLAPPLKLLLQVTPKLAPTPMPMPTPTPMPMAAPTAAQPQTATPACTYRIAFGPRAGQKVLTVQGAMPRQRDVKHPLCADVDGFSLHATVRCGADDRKALEQLCRYITRPALGNERVQTNAAGQVVLKLKSAWRDGTKHLVMSPLEFMQRLAAMKFMQRLAALVPRPRLHLIRLVSA